MAEKIIQIKNVKKVYPMGKERVIAINGISLDIEKSETCCLLGKSGSGKSTLLNLTCGLEKPTKGEIIFKKHHIERMDENQLAKFRQEYVGFIFQSYNLMMSLTALENVALPLIFRRVPLKERNKRALEMLKAVGLGDRAGHKPAQMSGGQQQRVSIARAFINNPEVIFADEPTGNLDSKTTREMMNLMLSLSRENNQTLVIVTHDIELSEYADKIIHILDGRIERTEEKIKTENMQINGGLAL